MRPEAGASEDNGLSLHVDDRYTWYIGVYSIEYMVYVVYTVVPGPQQYVR